jgi:hypothetical protein
LNAREPMLPQIAHAIGNSYACPLLPKDHVQGTLAGNRPMADHSYLANQALWDDWFLSGITPQNSGTFAKTRVQRLVATEFLDGTTPLPVARYHPNLAGKDPVKTATKYFSSATPQTSSIAEIASLIQVEGMFNVNSTSVEAWKAMLGGRKGRPVLPRDDTGKESVKSGGTDIPVAGLLSPTDGIANGSEDLDITNPAQWTGRRTLTDDQLDHLARAIVKEVRKRGPILSLADFVNRRVGTDQQLARSGAIQSALDADSVKINAAFSSNIRVTSAGSNFVFPDAERGPISQGIPGIVNQADILTPIAPILSARSDTFLIRSYGEKTDPSGKVLARAWCEAVVQRDAPFVDPSDPPEKNYSTINQINQSFGRRFEIVSFRWLNTSEV